MEPFVAIDFETADPQRDSACAVGLCRVEGDAIVRREVRLIRPPRGMNRHCQNVHGITWAQVARKPPFGEVWPTLLPVLDGVKRLAAHNAAFDRSVLEKCCVAAGLKPPALPWVCTMKLAQARWPKPHSNKLPDVCRRLGVPVGSHHEAGADAEMCARVLLALEGVTVREPEAPAAPPPEPAPDLSGWPCGRCGGPLDAVGCPRCIRAAANVVAKLPRRVLLDPAVRRLCDDVVRTGDAAHARDLVGWVSENWPRLNPGPWCSGGCGAKVNWMCSLCRRCLEVANGR